jgi:hypothetical protein
MKAKSTNYSTADSGAWMHVCDDAFLAQFRGRPCEICGSTGMIYNGRQTRSMGHHLLEKTLHKLHRYTPENIVVLCPKHHCQHERSISPHSDDTAAVAAFYEWLRVKRPEKWEWFKAHCRDKFENQWTYRDMYLQLGGRIKGDLKKDMRPLDHAQLIRKIEANAIS